MDDTAAAYDTVFAPADADADTTAIADTAAVADYTVAAVATAVADNTFAAEYTATAGTYNATAAQDGPENQNGLNRFIYRTQFSILKNI